MKRNYSVFIDHVGSFSDRYCAAYSDRNYTISEKFARVRSIPLLSGVDLNMNEEYMSAQDELKALVKSTGLRVNSVMLETTAKNIYKQGSFCNPDFNVRKQAVKEAKLVMDFASSIGCDLFAIWPGQDGYDYLFQADYESERRNFGECLRELSAYKPNMSIALEYKSKEPRIHSYVDSMAGTLLMIDKLGLDNVGVAMDYGHAYFAGENPAESVALLHMYGGKLLAVHMNDNNGLWDDDMIAGSLNTIPYLEFIYWLRKTGYTGAITFDQFPYREESRDAVSESAEWLNWIESLIDKADPDEIEAVLKKKNAVESSRLIRKIIKGE